MRIMEHYKMNKQEKRFIQTNICIKRFFLSENEKYKNILVFFYKNI